MRENQGQTSGIRLYKPTHETSSRSSSGRQSQNKKSLVLISEERSLDLLASRRSHLSACDEQLDGIWWTGLDFMWEEARVA